MYIYINRRDVNDCEEPGLLMLISLIRMRLTKKILINEKLNVYEIEISYRE